jgi:hypothetical protein
VAESYGNIASTRLGSGAPMGAPTGILSQVASAGGLTGAYKYIYYEVDGDDGGLPAHNTPYSAELSVVAAANKYTITVPQGRKGTFGRVLCRTKAGGSVFYVLKDFGQGQDFFRTVFIDNTADGALVTLAPANVDTTRCYNIEINPNVKFVRSNPASGSSVVCDLTVLSGAPSDANSFNIHSYGTVTAYSGLGNSFHSLHVGVAGTYGHVYCRWVSDIGDESLFVDVFKIDPRGEIIQTPAPWTSGTPSLHKITGPAHTTLTASTEAPDILWNFSRTVQFATGALAAQRAVKITPPTYAFVAASTLTDAYTVSITGAPVAGANATLTRTWALGVVGDVELNGSLKLGTAGTYATLTSSGASLVFPAGTAANPGLVVGGALTTGFLLASGTIAVSVAGTQKYIFGSSQFFLQSDSGSVELGASSDVKYQRDANGNALLLSTVRQVAFRTAANATGATIGYMCIPTSAGAPTGVPSNVPTGQVAFQYDSTNNKIYVYNGAWKSTVALT